MRRLHFSRNIAFLLLLSLSACATPPRHINNVCAVFDQRSGWFNNWHQAAYRVSAKYDIPVPILMATIRKESGFNADARPPRKYLLGLIPWGYVSTANGFSQALDGTWDQYRRVTGNVMARRSEFADAIDFVGWYYDKSASLLNIPRDDVYHLYLAYYLGWSNYQRGAWLDNPAAQRLAQATAQMAADYATQIQQCAL
ncbi:MAG TPA: hypothetical protein VMU69_03145 [Bradyrhizobium sp.]|nr:hypothetical protein [Bradyrhizobium sp.]